VARARVVAAAAAAVVMQAMAVPPMANALAQHKPTGLPTT